MIVIALHIDAADVGDIKKALETKSVRSMSAAFVMINTYKSDPWYKAHAVYMDDRLVNLMDLTLPEELQEGEFGFA